MSYVVGQPIRDGFDLIDNAGAAVNSVANGSGLWTTKTAYLIATPATTATLTITFDASGRYGTDFTPSVAGDWRAVVEYNDGAGLLRRFAGTYNVAPALSPVVPAVTIVSVPTSDDPISVVPGDVASLSWQSTDWSDLTDADVTFQATRLQTGAEIFDDPLEVTVSDAGEATQTVSIVLDGTQSDDFRPGLQYRYEVNATLSDETTVTLAHGPLSARDA